MSNRKTFEDGSYIEWKDRENVRYVEESFTAIAWVDYDEGFFFPGRVIKSSSISEWYEKPEGVSSHIDEAKKQEIVDKIKQYYKNKKIRVE